MRKDFENDISLNCKTNSKGFWEFASSRLKVKTRVGDLQTTEGEFCNDSEEKANMLNDFCSVYTTEDTVYVPAMTPKCNNVCNTIHVPEDDIHEKLKELNPSKSVWPDELHPRVLKRIKCHYNRANFCNMSFFHTDYETAR